MKRSLLILTCALMAAASGCCCTHGANQCNPCGGMGYGAGFSPSMSQPMMAPFSSCPGGNCAPGGFPGAYMGAPTTAYAAPTTAYMNGSTTAYMGAPATAYTVPTTAALDYLPHY